MADIKTEDGNTQERTGRSGLELNLGREVVINC